MAYLDQTRRASPGSMAAVIGLHAAIGVALVAGLTVSGVIPAPDRPVDTFDLPDPPPPSPTPEKPKPEQKAETPTKPEIYVPPTKFPLDGPRPTFGTADDFPLEIPPFNPGEGKEIGPVVPSSVPTIDPVGAAPRNDPGGWVTTQDYRSDWIRREMTGTARFRLEIAANGKVTDCTITGSTGHEALDAATCRLIERRARFQPARGSDGEPVAGSYSNAVRWVLPD